MKYRKFNHNEREKIDIRGKLRENKTNPYKRFGQNFLIDESYVNFMIDSLNLTDTDYVIEIGPGMGSLTKRLYAELGIRYLAIEIDEEKISFLNHEYPGINILNESILTADIFNLIKDKKEYKVIGSLPFNISKKVISKFSEIEKRPSKAVFMVQKEVGQDYVSTKYTTFLSIYLHSHWNVMDIQVVPAKAFYPIPRVDGLNMVLEPKIFKDYKFIKFAKVGFSKPRKKLGNILSLDKDNPYYNLRPHQLSLQDWYKLFDQVHIIE